MATIITLDGPPGEPAPEPKAPKGCKCVFNSRTGKSVPLCPVDKTVSRSGWAFKKGSCSR